MSRYALDASAVLALIHGEPGGDRVAQLLGDCLICSVNLAEVVGVLARDGYAAPLITRIVARLGIEVIDFDTELAFMAGLLRPLTDPAGLSLGDRTCLATAKRAGLVAVTTEKAWAKIGKQADVIIETIR